jgi:hypothetical protein
MLKNESEQLVKWNVKMVKSLNSWYGLLLNKIGRLNHE